MTPDRPAAEPLSSRPVVELMAGAAVTDLGAGLFQLVGPWLMYDLTRSAVWVGLVAAVQGVMPWSGPVMGWLVDHADRRLVLALAVLAQAAGAGGLAVLVAAHEVNVAATLAAVVVIAAGLRLQLLTGSALRQTLTPTGSRLRLNSWWALITLLSSYGAPGLAGFLLQWRGVAFTLLVEAAASVPLLMVAWRLAPNPGHAPAASPGGSLREAVARLRAERGLWLYTWAMAFWNWNYAGVAAILVYFYRSSLHFSAAEVGLAGLVAGLLPVGFTLFSARLNHRWGPGKVMVGGLMLSGLGMLAMPMLANPSSVGTALGAIDGPIGPIMAALSTMTQNRIPVWLYGRVMAARLLISMGATPTAGILAGLLASRWGPGPVMAGFGGLTVVGASVGAWRTRLARVSLTGQVSEEEESGWGRGD